MSRSTLVGLLAMLFIGGDFAATSALAQQFEFAPPPHINTNRVYSVDRKTGAVGACEFLAKQGTNGLTRCFPNGEGAGPQVAGDYHLVPSRMTSEAGLFRVNANTGDMSICYVNVDKVVCTAMAH